MTGSPAVRFSVIVPAYNSAGYVRDAIDSVLAQTHASLEVVVVDDGSSDGTREVLGAYAADPRVRCLFLDRSHGGPSRPRNAGIAAARGEVFVVLDADDLLRPGALASVEEALRLAPDAGLVFFNSAMVDFASGQALGKCLDEYGSFWQLHRRPVGPDVYVIDDTRLHAQMIETNFIKTSGTAVPRSVVEEVGPFDETLTNADDWDLWLRVARRRTYAFVDRQDVVYRRRQGSVTDRGSMLVNNRIKVLTRQIAEGATPGVRRSTARALSLNYAQLGFSRRLALELVEARVQYRRSMSYGVSWMALKGWLVTWLGASVLGRRTTRPDDPPRAAE